MADPYGPWKMERNVVQELNMPGNQGGTKSNNA
jgi:hypothetical protein